jgi:hypothetical protein
MTSYFDQLLGNEFHPLYAVLETWLRSLRDSTEECYDSFFSADIGRSVIKFQDCSMDWQGRNKLNELMVPVLRTYAYLGIKRLSPSIMDYLPWKRGCEVEIQIAKPEALRELVPFPPELTRILYERGRLLGEELYRKQASTIFPDPFEWDSLPLGYIPALWLWLKPRPGRSYPSLNSGFQGRLKRQICELQEKFPDPRFSLARLVETDRVWIMFDYRGENLCTSSG